jgi:hypothetical protein
MQFNTSLYNKLVGLCLIGVYLGLRQDSEDIPKFCIDNRITSLMTDKSGQIRIQLEQGQIIDLVQDRAECSFHFKGKRNGIFSPETKTFIRRRLIPVYHDKKYTSIG